MVVIVVTVAVTVAVAVVVVVVVVVLVVVVRISAATFPAHRVFNLPRRGPRHRVPGVS